MKSSRTLRHGGNYQLYPGLLDTCFQLLSNFWEVGVKELAKGDDLFVPFSISSPAVLRAARAGTPIVVPGRY